MLDTLLLLMLNRSAADLKSEVPRNGMSILSTQSILFDQRSKCLHSCVRVRAQYILLIKNHLI